MNSEKKYENTDCGDYNKEANCKEKLELQAEEMFDAAVRAAASVDYNSLNK